jgi:GTP-binding protein
VTDTPDDADENAAARELARLEAGRWLFTQEVTFVRGVVNLAGLPEADRPEVTFAGRSNVGKSSLINALVNRKGLARASAEPGRTRELNYFDLSGRVFLVDLPGFGHAKAPKAEIARWTSLTRDYLRGRTSLQRVFLLIDARRGVMDNDEEIMALLDSAASLYQIVLTKADKLRKGEVDAVREGVLRVVARHPAAYPFVLSTSSETGDGLPELRAEIASLAGVSAPA